jgi:uncharacterized membrane-anchored protein
VLTEWRGLLAPGEPHTIYQLESRSIYERQSFRGKVINKQTMNEQVMSKPAAHLNWTSVIPPMRYANVPTVGARYWAAISLASVFGCNLGDFVSLYLHWGHWVGLFPLAVIFAALVVGEHHIAHFTEAWYWAVVIVLRTAATNIADLATHTFEWPYPRVILGLTVIQALVILPVLPRLVQSGNDRTGRPATDSWYWISLLTAGALGTAIGDWVAEDLHLGTGGGTLVLSAVFAVILALGKQSRWTTKASYWLAIIAVRSAGTTAGDWLAFREEPGLINGLHLGLPLSTAFTCALFVGTLFLWSARRSHSGGAQ